jgi:hypothetical protein
MHPELNMHIAHLRIEELSAAPRHRATDASASRRSIRSMLRRRRDTPLAVGGEPSPIVLLPPPREERDTTGQQRRVA